MEDKIRIKLSIGNRQYPLSIAPEDETQVRRAAETVNEKLRTFMDSYSVADPVDLLSMCALYFATEFERLQQVQNKAQSEVSQKLALIEGLIEKGL
jgi:cell division protein ZapA